MQLTRAALAIALALGLAGASFAAARPALPLRFESLPSGFVARMPGYSLAIAPGEVALAVAERVVRFRVAGANAGATLSGEAPSSAPSHFFLGSDRARWRSSVTAFERVRASGVRPGVDVVYYGAEGELEFDLVAAPGADPASIEWAVTGADGIAPTDAGALAVRVGERTFLLRAPVAYQGREGVREPVSARFEPRAGGRFGFAVGDYDRARSLVIDPVLSVASYLGGTSNDEGRAVAIDASGAIYVAGETISLDLPAGPNAAQPAFAGGEQDVFVAKLDPSGSKLLWLTYLGGSRHDRGFAIAIDAYGSAVVTGRTGSLDFPTVAPLQAAIGGGDDDAFVAKLAPDGTSLTFSTYLGGTDIDRGLAIGVDANGEITVGGITLSADFPIAAAFQPGYGGGNADGFVAKLSAGGAALRFASFIGGSASDNVRALTLDAQGRATLCGDTDSPDFPVAAAFQPIHGGAFDAWVGRVDPAGTALAPATYFGGSADDFALGCDTAPAGETVIGGITVSPDLPLLHPVQSSPSGDLDAFVAKLDAELATPAFSTYLGGAATDFGLDVAIDARGGATLVGSSDSTDYPVANAIQATNGGYFDTIVTRIGATGAMDWSTYLGGSQSEITFDRMGVAMDAHGRPVLTGITRSANHPLAVPVQPVWAGADEAFFARIAVAPEVRVALLPDAGGTRLRLALASGAQAAELAELKIWITLQTGNTVGLVPEPLVVSVAPQGFTQLVDAVLPAAIVFPGATVGARLLEPGTGRVRSESLCRSVPCN